MRLSAGPATPPLSLSAAASDTKRTEAAAEPKYNRTSGRSDLDTPCNQHPFERFVHSPLSHECIRSTAGVWRCVTLRKK